MTLNDTKESAPLNNAMVHNMMSTYFALSNNVLKHFHSSYFDMVVVEKSIKSKGKNPVTASMEKVASGVQSVLPIVNLAGIRAFKHADPHLKVTHSTLVYRGELSICDGQFYYNEDDTQTDTSKSVGAFFKGDYGSQTIFGYASREEVLDLIPITHQEDEQNTLFIMHEMAIYRALYRLDHAILSPFIKEYLQWHDIRNFFIFNSYGYDQNAFMTALDTINTRRDVLCRTSSLWRETFEREAIYLAHAIAKMAERHGFPNERVQQEAYSLSYFCAGMDQSINPSSGSIYLCANEEFKSNSVVGITLVIAESVRGKLARAFSSAGLKSHFTQLVYKGDKFKFNGERVTQHVREDHTAPKGELVGAYCYLQFIDESTVTVFLDAAHFKMLADSSDNSAWHNCFFERMCMKEVLKEALNKADWNKKQFIHKSRFV